MRKHAGRRWGVGLGGTLVVWLGMSAFPALPGAGPPVVQAYGCYQKWLPYRAWHPPHTTSTPHWVPGYYTTQSVWHPAYTTYQRVKVSSGYNKTVTVSPGHYKTVSHSTAVPGHWSTVHYSTSEQQTSWVTKTVQQAYTVPVQKTVTGWHTVTGTVWKSVGSRKTGTTGTTYPIGLPTWMAPWGSNPNAGQAASTGGSSSTGSATGSGGQQLVPVQETTKVYGPYQVTVDETAYRSVTTQVPVTRTVNVTQSKQVWVAPTTKTTTSRVWVPAVTKQVWVPPQYKSVPVHHPGYSTARRIWHPGHTVWVSKWYPGYSYIAYHMVQFCGGSPTGQVGP